MNSLTKNYKKLKAKKMRIGGEGETILVSNLHFTKKTANIDFSDHSLNHMFII